MSISSEVRRAGPYSGNGSTTSFAFAFKVFFANQVRVVRTVSGVETVLTLTTDYTVSLNADQNANPGGSVVMVTAPPAGHTITITSNVANLQPTVVANLGAFYPEVINDSLDRATIQIQQLDERLDRALTIPFSSSGVNTQLPVPASGALIGWDAGATALQNYSGVPVGSTTYQYVHRTLATAGQTAFVLPVSYTLNANAITVFVNGLRVEQGATQDYVETNTTTITFNSGLALNDLVVVAIHGDIDAAATPPNYTIDSIAALRLLNSGSTANHLILLRNYVMGDGGGIFRYDSTDNSSADNNGTIIVDAAGRRWKRQYSGPLNANWFGNLSSGFTAAVQAAITAAGTQGVIQIPYGSYSLTGTLTLLTGQTLVGIGGRPTITRAFAGTMIDASAAATTLENLDLRGVGATYSNTTTDVAVLYSNGSNYYQAMRNVWIIDNAGPCISFSASDAGSMSKFIGCIFQRTTVTNPAVVLPTSLDTVGYREFYDCRGGGSWLLRFNSGINTKIIGGDCVNLDFSGSDGVSLRAVVNGVRIATGGSALTVYGNDSSITGCIIAGPGVITGAASRNNISGNVLQAGQTWTDNSTATGTNTNTIDYAFYDLSATTEWGADTAAPVLGNGTLTAYVTRRGKILKIDILLTMGSTTTFGTGNWYFKLPAPFSTWNAAAPASGSVRMLDNTTAWFVGTATVLSGANKIYLYPNNSGGQVGPTAPFTWAQNDTLALSIEYVIA